MAQLCVLNCEEEVPTDLCPTSQASPLAEGKDFQEVTLSCQRGEESVETRPASVRSAFWEEADLSAIGA
eukprot:6186601-Pleurochrysis_carterae.AAC.3